MEILVFKTNIVQFKDIRKVGNILMKEKDILTWNVDSEDCDRVLRIVAQKNISQKVEMMVNKAGFYCRELL